MLIRSEPPRYRAYMLRCWEVRSPEPGGPVTWRFSVEDPHTGQKHGFVNLDVLVDFLESQLISDDSGHHRRDDVAE
jgi:hypothetical protein